MADACPLKTASAILSFCSLFFILLFTGCASHRATPQQRFTEAKSIFDQTTKEYHIPSADAQGVKKEELLRQSIKGYESLLQKYPDQPNWCAQALRSLGNIHASQGRLDEAVRCFDKVAQKYTKQEWEILQSWKSAGDLLWDDGQPVRAMAFYKRIIDRFDNADGTALYKIIVKSAKKRLSEGGGLH